MHRSLPAIHIFMILCASTLLQVRADTQLFITTGPPSSVTANAAETMAVPPGCPIRDGILDSISVPVKKPTSLQVYVANPAPEGGIRVQLSSGNPSIVTVGDAVQGYRPEVFIPAGQNLSNLYTILGVRVGQTTLTLSSLTPGFVDGTFPMGAWDINPDNYYKFLDANPPVNHCRVGDESSLLSTDPTLLATCGQTVRGVAADGISPLLMRVSAGRPGTACFQIVSLPGTDAVATRVFELFDGPASNMFSAFPGGSLANGTGIPHSVPGRGAALDQADYAAQCAPGGPMKPIAALQSISQSSTPTKTTTGRRAASSAVTARSAADPRVRITSPVAGQQYAPGQTIWITVEITPPLVVNDIGVRVPGLGRVPGIDYTGSQYRASLVVPDAYAGELTLIPAVSDSLNTPIRGAEVTVVVRSGSVPTRLILPTDFYVVDDPPPSVEHIDVLGKYADGITRNLSSASAGTTFQSSNPAVLTVDPDGKVTTVARGTAVVIVENSGVKTKAVFVVEDPRNPLPPRLITTLQTSQSTPVLNTNTGFYTQDLHITYPGEIGSDNPAPIVGPLFVVFSGLPSGVTLMNGLGLTRSLAPVGSPYTRIYSLDRLTLRAGESVTIPLEFLNPNGGEISYSTSVYRTSAVP